MATRLSLAFAATAALVAAPVTAQLLPSGAGGGVVGGVLGGAGRTVGGLTQPILGDQRASSGQQAQLVAGAFDRVITLASSAAGTANALLDLRQLRLSLLADAHKAELALDGDGNVVRRDRLVAVEPDTASLAAATRAFSHARGLWFSCSLGCCEARGFVMDAPQ